MCDEHSINQTVNVSEVNTTMLTNWKPGKSELKDSWHPFIYFSYHFEPQKPLIPENSEMHMA